MIIFGACLIILIAGLIWGKLTCMDDGGPLAAIVAGAALSIIAGLFLLIHSIETRGEIAEFEATRDTFNAARLNGDLLENAALQTKAIEANQWLASVQYYNGLALLDDFIPDAVDELEPIR